MALPFIISSRARFVYEYRLHVIQWKIYTNFKRHNSHPSTTALSTNSSKPILNVLPSNDVMMDQRVKMTVSGLQSHERITLQVFTNDSVSTYGALGHYISDHLGNINTSMSHCYGGTFTGKKEM